MFGHTQGSPHLHNFECSIWTFSVNTCFIYMVLLGHGVRETLDILKLITSYWDRLRGGAPVPASHSLENTFERNRAKLLRQGSWNNEDQDKIWPWNCYFRCRLLRIWAPNYFPHLKKKSYQHTSHLKLVCYVTFFPSDHLI